MWILVGLCLSNVISYGYGTSQPTSWSPPTADCSQKCEYRHPQVVYCRSPVGMLHLSLRICHPWVLSKL